MSRYTDEMEKLLFGRKQPSPKKRTFSLNISIGSVAAKVLGTGKKAVGGVIPLADREPYCWGCKEGLSTFKIGKYVYHSIDGGRGASGCSIADRALRQEKS